MVAQLRKDHHLRADAMHKLPAVVYSVAKNCRPFVIIPASFTAGGWQLNRFAMNTAAFRAAISNKHEGSAILRLPRPNNSRPFDSRSPRARRLQESIIVRFRSDPDSVQTRAASGEPAQVAHHDSMFEQMFSEGAGDLFILDFHHHEVRDARKNMDARQL